MENTPDGRRDLIRAVSDVDGGYGPRADEGVHGLDEKSPMSGIKALAGLVKNQQAGFLDQRPSEQSHPLEASRKGEQGPAREFKQLEPTQPLANQGSLPC